MIATTISTTMATAAQKYGGGTISGASAFSSADLVREQRRVIIEYRCPAVDFAARGRRGQHRVTEHLSGPQADADAEPAADEPGDQRRRTVR